MHYGTSWSAAQSTVLTLRVVRTYGRAVSPDPSPSIQLASEDNSCSLTLHSPSWVDEDMLWLTAECHGTELSASTGVLTIRGDALPEFLDDLESSWRGWTGEKTWALTEENLALAAAHEHGRIHVRCRLWENRLKESWSVEIIVVVEPGEQLRLLARQAHALLGRS